jgi:hypothetical protein
MFVIAKFATHPKSRFSYVEDDAGVLMVFETREAAETEAKQRFGGQFGEGWVVQTTEKMRRNMRNEVSAVTESFKLV